MGNEKTKEIREWTTLVVSILTLIVIPASAYGVSLFVKNQKLELQKEISEKYQSKEASSAEAARINTEFSTDRATMREISAKLDTVILGNNGLQHDLSALKEQIQKPK